MTPRVGFGPGNIDCGDVLDELSIFLDDETDPATKGRIRDHLEACAPCLKQFGLERDVRALITRCCGGGRRTGQPACPHPGSHHRAHGGCRHARLIRR